MVDDAAMAADADCDEHADVIASAVRIDSYVTLYEDKLEYGRDEIAEEESTGGDVTRAD